MQAKRVEKKAFIEDDKLQFQKMQVLELAKIQEEDRKFLIRKKEKQDVQIQIKQMREQLMIKKQKLIDELKDMRKEFALNNDAGAESNYTAASPAKQQFANTKTSEFNRRNASVQLTQTGGMSMNTKFQATGKKGGLGFKQRKTSMNDYQPTATYDDSKKHKFKKNSSLGELSPKKGA